MNTPNPRPTDAIAEALRLHNVATELLTAQQLAEAVRQALACGDLMRHTNVEGTAQSVTYVPNREHFALQQRIAALETQLASIHTQSHPDYIR